MSDTKETSTITSLVTDLKPKPIHCNHSNDQLSSSEWVKIEAIMYPGGVSQSGFLKSPERLRSVIEKDEMTLKRLDISCKQIVDRLTTLMSKYYRTVNLIYELENATNIGAKVDEAAKSVLKLKIDEDSVCVEDKFKISKVSYNGAQTCPFQNKQLDKRYHGYEYGSTDFTFTDMITGESICFNTLLLHMIEAHHFFEGSVDHRLDPEAVISFLGLEPEKSYAPVYHTHTTWSSGGGRSFNWSGDFSSDSDVEDEPTVPESVSALSRFMIDHKLIEILDPVSGQVLLKLDAFIGPADFDFSDNIVGTVHQSLRGVSYYDVRRASLLKKNEWNVEYNAKYLSKDGTPASIYDEDQISKIVKAEEDMKVKYLAQDPKDRKATKDMQGIVIVRENNKPDEPFSSRGLKYYPIDLFGYEAQDSFTLGYSHYSLREYRYVDI